MDFYSAFFTGGYPPPSQSSAIIQNANLENEMGTLQKPPKLLNIEDYSGWQGRFRTWVQAHHFICWLKIESRYVAPLGENGYLKPVGSLQPLEIEQFQYEKKMVNILQQAIKEEIMMLLQHDGTAYSIWEALKIKFLGSTSMVKSKVALLKKEFEIFTHISGETTKDLIDRYCHLVLQMKRLNIEKTNEEWVDKLADALPHDEWGTF